MGASVVKRGRKVDLKTKVFTDLPAPAAQLVWDVVAATRLRRTEKRAVAEELVDHFKAGLEGGATAEELVRRFGDVNQAAKLIRRAKLRNRSVTEKFCVFLLRSMAAMVVFYALLTGYYLTGKPNPKVDYLAMMNAKAAAVPEQDRAWPLYREAFIKVGNRQLFADELDCTHSLLETKHGDARWNEAVQYLGERREVMDLLRQAGSKAGLGFVLGNYSPEDYKLWPELQEIQENRSRAPENEKGMLMAVMIPHVQPLIGSAQFLCMDMLIAAHERDRERLLADFRAAVAVTQQLRECALLITDLVAIRIANQIMTVLGRILEESPKLLETDDLRAMAHVLAAAALKVRLDSDRVIFHDLVQRIYTDDGHGDGRLTLQGVQGLLNNIAPPPGESVIGSDYPALVLAGMIATSDSRRKIEEFHDRYYQEFLAEAETPLWLKQDSVATVKFNAAGKYERYRKQLVYLMVYDMDGMGMSSQHCEAKREGILAAIALELYRRKEGKWPAVLVELTPGYLPKRTTDPHDGKPLKYALVDGKPVVYSVGLDRDDDHGRAAVSLSTGKPAHDAAREWIAPSVAKENPASVPDGDWILWPISPR